MQQLRRPRILFVAISSSIGLLAIAFAFFHSRPRPPLNAILVTLGSTRADHIGCYGYPFARTPALDELAEKGALFENAYSSVPWTLPSHATIFTSLYPPEHGLHVDGKKRLGDGTPVLAEFLKVRNYDTAAFVSKYALCAKFGLNRGFDTYDDTAAAPKKNEDAQMYGQGGATVMDRALEWLKERRQRPFFCWIHLCDAQSPYDTRREMFGDTFVERPYDAGIAFADQQVKRLTDFLKTQKLSEKTLIVAVGDHGEGLMEHAEAHHGKQIYNSTLHVPLIVAGPNFIKPGTRVATPVSHVDLAPTILSSLGIGPEMKRYRGTALTPALAGNGVRPRIFHIETYFPVTQNRGNKLIGLVTAGWKYIHGTPPELYDLNADPAETNNVATTEESQLKKLANWFRAGQQNMADRIAPRVELTSTEWGILFGECSVADEDRGTN